MLLLSLLLFCSCYNCCLLFFFVFFVLFFVLMLSSKLEAGNKKQLKKGEPKTGTISGLNQRGQLCLQSSKLPGFCFLFFDACRCVSLKTL